MSPLSAGGTWGQEVQTFEYPPNYSKLPSERSASNARITWSVAKLQRSLSLSVTCSLKWYGMVTMVGISCQWWYLTFTPKLHTISASSNRQTFSCSLVLCHVVWQSIRVKHRHKFRVPTRGSDDCIMYPCSWWLQLGLPVSKHDSYTCESIPSDCQWTSQTQLVNFRLSIRVFGLLVTHDPHPSYPYPNHVCVNRLEKLRSKHSWGVEVTSPCCASLTPIRWSEDCSALLVCGWTRCDYPTLSNASHSTYPDLFPTYLCSRCWLWLPDGWLHDCIDICHKFSL